MENINFIPANNLPVAEGDEVSVLCLENGEMKQKPANGLGGGKADVVIEVTGSEDATIKSGSYNEVVTKLQNGEMVTVDIIGTRSSDYGASKAVSVSLSVDGGEVAILAYLGSSSMQHLYMGNNGEDYIYFD